MVSCESFYANFGPINSLIEATIKVWLYFFSTHSWGITITWAITITCVFITNEYRFYYLTDFSSVNVLIVTVLIAISFQPSLNVIYAWGIFVVDSLLAHIELLMFDIDIGTWYQFRFVNQYTALANGRDILWLAGGYTFLTNIRNFIQTEYLIYSSLYIRYSTEYFASFVHNPGLAK